ncbi:YqcC family protein [Photobacterium indicum]|uniref:Pseudouridine synthase n=1 Tax=Photobacterium indicum TaxID=81447 RepID=A0A2T3L1M6_9GAMM|nr:YqcC family protein [Photobacterium indicum]PSV42412.1 pseudouridine synthase [Photobacterium indicum]
MDKYRHSMLLLEKLEAALRNADLWENVPPSDVALASTEPFAVDSLSCSQWLQWVFIPRMTQLIALKQPLPQHFELSPYVEEAMKHDSGINIILGVTRELDNLFKAQ